MGLVFSCASTVGRCLFSMAAHELEYVSTVHSTPTVSTILVFTNAWFILQRVFTVVKVKYYFLTFSSYIFFKHRLTIVLLYYNSTLIK